jgi:2-polyprenyl-3-methyl-5-hydroxy-6-metoxy-1,4-benzoquinol methylase
MKISPEFYDKDYFEHGEISGKSAYTDYRWLPERTYKEIRELISYLNIDPKKRVLDFGCAKGYWVKALREYGIESYGVDISDYALKMADKAIQGFLDVEIKGQFDYIVARNTLEHIEEEELGKILKNFLNHTDTVFFSVPLTKEDKGLYIIPIAEEDKSHLIRWTAKTWAKFCSDCGWKSVSLKYKVNGIHDKWSEYPEGTGFFTLKK